MEDLIALPLGFLADQLFGDPPGLPHPVRWIGWLIQALESPLRRLFPERLGGLVLLLIVSGLSGGLTWGLLQIAGLWHPWCRLILASGFVYYGLAARSLAHETQAVLVPLAHGNLPEARNRLSGLVGRDTTNLSSAEICRACIETVAENTADGVVGPLFYAALAGPAGMWVYKAVNTLDSMVGYRNPRYLHFGWASARADDLLNLLPSRLTFLLIAGAALLKGHGARRALHIGWRDGHKHPSPNSGWAEAAMAGTLKVQLGGQSTYQGVVSEKPLLGEVGVMLSPEKVRQAVGIMLVAAWLALVVAESLTISRVYFLLLLKADPAWRLILGGVPYRENRDMAPPAKIKMMQP